MFCVVFVFSYILQVLEENPSNSKIIMKMEISLLDRFKLQINFEFKERDVGKKIVILGKNPEWAYLINLIITFGSSIRFKWNLWCWKAKTKWNKYVRNSCFLIQTFTMPKLFYYKRPQICTDFGIIFLLGWKFQKRKRLVIILFGLEDLFIIVLRFLELLELL